MAIIVSARHVLQTKSKSFTQLTMTRSKKSTRLTGCSQMRTHIHLSPTTEDRATSGLNPTQRLESALGGIHTGDLFSLQILTRSTLDLIPGCEKIQLELGLKQQYCDISVSSTGECFCMLAPLSHVSVGLENFFEGEVTPVEILIGLNGIPAKPMEGRLSAHQQLNEMHGIMAAHLTANIAGKVYRDDKELTQHILEIVRSAENTLAKHLVVTATSLHTIVRFKEVIHDTKHATTIEQPIGEPNFQSLVSTSPSLALEHLIRELDHDLMSSPPVSSEQGITATLDTRIQDPGPPLQARRPMERGVVVALGSNVGNKIEEIEKACRAIDEDPDMRIVDTSFLYETKPMYVEDQESFVNGACEVNNAVVDHDTFT